MTIKGEQHEVQMGGETIELYDLHEELQERRNNPLQAHTNYTTFTILNDRYYVLENYGSQLDLGTPPVWYLYENTGDDDSILRYVVVANPAFGRGEVALIRINLERASDVFTTNSVENLPFYASGLWQNKNGNFQFTVAISMLSRPGYHLYEAPLVKDNSKFV